ncbi:MAG: hypothetical protein AABM30_09755 [Actinomycetota bacterium]
MFNLIVYALMAIAVGVTTVTIASSRRAGTSLPLWPCFALAAFVLIEARVFVDTPSLTDAFQVVPNEQTTRYVSDRASGLFIGGGLTILGLACAGVFFAGLARRARAAAEDSIAPGLIVIGGAATVAAAGTGAALFSILADAASSDRAPTTVAAVYTIFDSLAYTGFTAMGFVTAGVAVASFRGHAFSRAVGWVSAFATGLFVLCTFLPFLSWAPALLWLFFAGIALVREEARRAPRRAPASSAAA